MAPLSGGEKATICPLQPAALIGLSALQLAAFLALVDLRLAILPLGLYLLLVGVAPFFHRWRLFLPAVTHGRRDRPAVALSFDDGPDPATTPRLLDLLETHRAKAAFFVVGERVRAYPALVERIRAAGHELCNHTGDHDPLLMLRGTARLRAAIRDGQRAISAFGLRSRAFRPPALVVSSRLWRVLLEEGLFLAGARVRPRDWGNRRLGGLAQRVLRRTRPGDVIQLHDRDPGSPARVEAWLSEVAAILQGLAARGLRAERLSAVIGRPVAVPIDAPGAGPVAGFYDALAEGYDAEQAAAGQRGLRKAEWEAVMNRIPDLALRARVLEIGAGTGRFTLEIARRARSVLAVDVSPGMLAVLAEKARREGLGNVLVLPTDAAELAPALGAQFDLICSFSVFEYLGDLAEVLQHLCAHLAPSGRVYFTTARTGPWRLFVQIGNALRQGVWLHGRTRGEVRRAIAAAGLTSLHMSTLGRGGLILEVLAADRPEGAGSTEG